MICEYDVVRAFKNAKKEGRETALILNEDNTQVLDAKTNEYVCTMQTYIQFLRKKYHCDFECIYHEHVSLTTIYKCKECGTIIFTGDDERYDPNLKCPVCSDYNHHDYWTKEDLDNDPEKQKTLNAYIEMQQESIEAEKRREQRGGLYDWQIFEKKHFGKKYFCAFEMTDFSRNLGKYKAQNKPWYKRMIDLEVRIGTKDGDSSFYTTKTRFKIPLSPYSFYIKYIYRYTKKCSPDLRKYFPWQKKK